MRVLFVVQSLSERITDSTSRADGMFHFFRYLAALAAVLSIISPLSEAQAKPAQKRAHADRPNIVIFLVDDMGWTDTSVAFHTKPTELNQRYHTPHMARLAARGVVFTQAYASALCSPSRISLMTGMNEARHGVTNWTLDPGKSPDPDHPIVAPPQWPLNGVAPTPGTDRTTVATCLPAILSQSGYHTIHVGKAHFGAKDTPGANPLNLGFDVNIAGHAAGGPGSYYGIYNFSGAHRNARRVWDVPGLEAYHGRDIYLTEALTREALKAVEAATDKGKPFYLYLSHYAIHAPWEPDTHYLPHYQSRGLKGLPAAYASMIESMDKSLGDVMDWLAETGCEQNTLVIFMSDNGVPAQCPRNSPLRGHKLTPYEGGVRVPMIVSWPGHTAEGARQAAPVKIEDLFPTVLAAAGVDNFEVPQEVDGRDLRPLFDATSNNDDSDRVLVWHFPHTYDSLPWSVIRKGDWKLIWYYADQRAELYNLAQDISESNNLADRRPQVRGELSAALCNRLHGLGALIPIDKQTGRPFGLPGDP